MEAGKGKIINRESGTGLSPAICVTGFLGGGGRGVMMHLHCIASFSPRSLIHVYLQKCCVSLHHGPFLAPLPPQDSCLLRPRLQDRVLHCHHLPDVRGPLLFFFFRPVPTPARLPHWGRYAPLLSCIDWPRDGGVGQGSGRA